MSAIPPVQAEQAPLLARPYYQSGDPGPILATLAHVPELLEVCAPFLGTVFGPTVLTGRIKELVIVRTSVRLGCRYCVEAHSVVALDSGLSPDEVLALRRPAVDVNLFPDPGERAVLAWVDVVAGERGSVDAAERDRLAARFADHEVVELTLLIGATLMLNRFCTALDLPSSPETLRRLTEAGLR